MRELHLANSASTDPVVVVTGLSRSFGSKKALNDVTLAVPRGCVFGLVGENGAGKSTLIKHLLGLWRTQTGRVTVFGLNPVTEPTAVLGRIGKPCSAYEMARADTSSKLIVPHFSRTVSAACSAPGTTAGSKPAPSSVL